MKCRQLIRLLKRAGWRQVRYINGDHVLLERGGAYISIPDQSSDASAGLMHRYRKALKGGKK